MDEKDLKFDDMCCGLIAGGWNSKDAKLMSETYGITLGQAERICKRIGELWEDSE